MIVYINYYNSFTDKASQFYDIPYFTDNEKVISELTELVDTYIAEHKNIYNVRSSIYYAMCNYLKDKGAKPTSFSDFGISIQVLDNCVQYTDLQIGDTVRKYYKTDTLYNKMTCVDRFYMFSLLSRADNIHNRLNRIEKRYQRRNASKESYHNSTAFEQDLSDLIAIRNYAKAISEKTKHFIENLTNSEYTVSEYTVSEYIV